MDNVRALIVDDEPLARDRIRGLLAGERDIEVVGECANGREAVAAIAAETPDLVFLDVQMPELNGFGVLDALDPERLPAIIFVTAHDEFALRAFDVHALDYLLKPFDRERFERSLERARAAVRNRRAGGLDERLAALLADLPQGRRYPARMLVKRGDRAALIRTAEIDWIESAGNYVRLHASRERYLLRETMSGLETKLDPEQFVRIHRGTMVNLDRVRELEPFFHGDYVVTLQDGTRLTLSRTFRDRVQARLGRDL